MCRGGVPVLNSGALTNHRSSSTTSVAVYTHVADVLQLYAHPHPRRCQKPVTAVDRRSAGARGTRDRQRLVVAITPMPTHAAFRPTVFIASSRKQKHASPRNKRSDDSSQTADSLTPALATLAMNPTPNATSGEGRLGCRRCDVGTKHHVFASSRACLYVSPAEAEGTKFQAVPAVAPLCGCFLH